MGLFNEIDRSRRIIMQRITKNIGRSHTNKTADLQYPVKRILISRPNQRLGNLLLLTPLLQELYEIFPDAKADLFVRGNLAPILFKNHPNIGTIIKLPGKPFKQLPQYIWSWALLRRHSYDIVINAEQGSSSGRLSSQFARAKMKFFGDVAEDIKQQCADFKHMAKYPVYMLRTYLAGSGLVKSYGEAPPLDLMLSPEETTNGKKLLYDIVKNNKKTICLFTYATGKKCYPESWWIPLYEHLLKKYPDCNIIEVLPAENVSQIGFKAPSFYSRDIRSIGALIANTDVFIGADSGIMHLASAVHTPTIGLFKKTDPNKYGPYANNSIAIDTTITTTDDIVAVLNAILREEETTLMLYREQLKQCM